MIWRRDIIVFGLVYWEVDDGGPVVRRANKERRTPDFQFPQDENPELVTTQAVASPHLGLPVRLPDGSSAFSPTDAMPLTCRAKVLLGIESTVSLVIVVLVTARAVNVLGS